GKLSGKAAFHDNSPEARLMSATVYRINALLSTLLHSLPVGTNLALFHLLWTLLSGRLLASRGALTPALDDAGLPKQEVYLALSALVYGLWLISPLFLAFD